MSVYTITTTGDEDKGIEHAAGDPAINKQEYLESCVHAQVLSPWTLRYQTSISSAAPIDVATAYVAATPSVQTQVNSLLGITPPAEGQTRSVSGATGLEGVA